ncbi:MAG: hypothetical protein RIQ56_928 [Candidatus Parcubacteria bacterium]
MGNLGRVVLSHTYNNIISVPNLLLAWKEFLRGKRDRADIQEFEAKLMQNVLGLHRQLAAKTYKHSAYDAFNISDPKPRNIHKAAVRDRLLHHAIYRLLSPFFDRTFIHHSYSCRVGKGAYKAMDEFQTFSRSISKNHTRTCWVLKCDVRKFFASIDQKVLMDILRRSIKDDDSLWLLSEILSSFHTTRYGVGLPLGNLTSQLLVNIYMNEFDQFVKHKLKARHYIRYADDFVLLSADRAWLEAALPQIGVFLEEHLHLALHPDKISIRTIASGVDFLGWVHFPGHRVLRSTTKRRVFRGIEHAEAKEATVKSYIGLLGHGNTKKLQVRVGIQVDRLRNK